MPEVLNPKNIIVSVVIPTIGRDSLLACVESVHRQSVPTDIIVVLDAPMKLAAVSDMLSSLPHRLLVTSGRKGGSHARNLGVQNAHGAFVAFLDDDDLWKEGKLDLQLHAMAEADSPSRTISVTATTFCRNQRGNLIKSVVPREPFDPHKEDIVDYLVQRRDIRYGRHFMQTSSILGPTELLAATPWNESWGKLEDWDLFSRLLSPEIGVDVLQLAEPLVIVHQASPGSVSATPNWRACSAFFEKYRQRMSRRSRADFVWSHLLRASLAERSAAGTVYALKHMLQGVPHFFSVVVGLSGVARR